MADAQQPRNWNEPASVPATAPAGYVPDSPYGDQQPANPEDGGWNE